MVCEDHLLYHWQHLWAIWSKSYYLIGYPGKQEFWSFSKKILHGVDFHRVAKFLMELQEAADDNQSWKNTDFMVLLCNWHFFPCSWNKQIILDSYKVKSFSFFFCVFMDLDFIVVHKNPRKGNSCNICPSWHYAYSIRYMYVCIYMLQ